MSTDNVPSPGSVITKEFLEQSLNLRIEKFTVHAGSTIGDGYTCVLHSVDIWPTRESSESLGRSNEPLHLLIKVYPTNAIQQVFMDQSGIFAIELAAYQDVIPELTKFLKDNDGSGAEHIKLPFAPYYGGRSTSKDQRQGSTTNLDNYIIMADLRKTGGFRLQDRFVGLDLDHYKLVIEAQATLHAVSWAYKCRKGVKLVEPFPILGLNGFKTLLDTSFEFILSNLRISEQVVKDDKRFSDGCSYLRSVYLPVAKLYNDVPFKEGDKIYTKDSIVRQPDKIVDNEEPWEVLIHGDAWSNNMLFRYDEVTGRPVEVIFIDLQLMREADPTTDMNYALFVSTSKDLRDKHLTSLLHTYYDRFEEVCHSFSVPLLPGWSWEELNRRFRRAQIFGAYMATGLLPVMLRNPDEIMNMDDVKATQEELESEDFFQSDKAKKLMEEFSAATIGPVLRDRVTGVIASAVEAGVI